VAADVLSLIGELTLLPHIPAGFEGPLRGGEMRGERK